NPDIGIICGSGLGGLANLLQDSVEFHYKDIPHFAVSTTPGHVGKLVIGKLAGRKVVCMVGRKHMYEGHHAIHTTYPIRIMKTLGVETLIVTNAAGGLNSSYHIGEFMVISDHVSLPGLSAFNPLIGPNIDEFGPRFPAISDAYDLELRVLAFLAAKKIGLPVPGQDSLGKNLSVSESEKVADGPVILTQPVDGRGLREGVYGFVGGPSFESRAEARFLRDALGADVVGMSTVSEVIVARHCGMKVLGLSLVTNMVAVSVGADSKQIAERIWMTDGANVNFENIKKLRLIENESPVANHEEVLATGNARVDDFQKLVVSIVEMLP
ncbi:hypothetical protein HK098_002723, partial [Nowakowskiella sp. JEL0407]